MSEASLGLSRVAICLSPTSTNQLPQLGLEIKCGEDCGCKRSAKERDRKKLKNPFKEQYFYKWMINIWFQLGRGSTGAL